MDALEFLKKKKELCETYICESCPLGINYNGHDVLCGQLLREYPEDGINIIEGLNNDIYINHAIEEIEKCRYDRSYTISKHSYSLAIEALELMLKERGDAV